MAKSFKNGHEIIFNEEKRNNIGCILTNFAIALGAEFEKEKYNKTLHDTIEKIFNLK